MVSNRSIEKLIAEYPQTLNEEQAKEFRARADEIDDVAQTTFWKPHAKGNARGGVRVLVWAHENGCKYIESYEVAWE